MAGDIAGSCRRSGRARQSAKPHVAYTAAAMGFYSRYLFPHVLEYAMRRDPIERQRPLALAGVRGEVLEIGFGTGLNLPHYPPGVVRVVALEPNVGVRRRARDRIEASPIAVELLGVRGDCDLPFDAGRFDSAVSTWTLCTIADVA